MLEPKSNATLLNEPIDQNNDNIFNESQEEEATTQSDELIAENPDIARILQMREENINESKINNSEQ